MRKGIYFLTSLALVSCVPFSVRKQFHCYSGGKTGLDTALNLRGCFVQEKITDKTGLYHFVNGKLEGLGIDTSLVNVIFYENGVSVYNFPDFESCYQGEMDYFSSTKHGFQGTYSLVGDTIKAKYCHPGYGNVWGVFTIWFLIKDRETIQPILRKNLGQTESEERRYPVKDLTNTPLAKFKQAEGLPSGEVWLMKYKWFWCDKEEYEEYLQSSPR